MRRCPCSSYAHTLEVEWKETSCTSDFISQMICLNEKKGSLQRRDSNARAFSTPTATLVSRQKQRQNKGKGKGKGKGKSKGKGKGRVCRRPAAGKGGGVPHQGGAPIRAVPPRWSADSAPDGSNPDGSAPDGSNPDGSNPRVLTRSPRCFPGRPRPPSAPEIIKKKGSTREIVSYIASYTVS